MQHIFFISNFHSLLEITFIGMLWTVYVKSTVIITASCVQRKRLEKKNCASSPEVEKLSGNGFLSQGVLYHPVLLSTFEPAQQGQVSYFQILFLLFHLADVGILRMGI